MAGLRNHDFWRFDTTYGMSINGDNSAFLWRLLGQSIFTHTNASTIDSARIRATVILEAHKRMGITVNGRRQLQIAPRAQWNYKDLPKWGDNKKFLNL